MTLFSIDDYRSVIREKISENKSTRGYQARLSEAAGVHSSYISRVINSHIQLTPDQAANLAEFWHLEPDETDYFLDLVLFERSTSSALKVRIQQRLSSIRRRRENLSSRFSNARVLETQDKSIYYSAWYFSAIHILLTIPQYRTAKEISSRLRLPKELVLATLETLEKIGLVQQVESHWRVLEYDLHIGEHESWARAHHGHWRQKSALKIQEFDSNAVHYSGVHTISESDALKLKQSVILFLEKSRKTIAPSPEEKLYFLGCDFYEI